MNCPKCKNKKGKPIRVDRVTQRCPQCRASIFVSHTGKAIARGGRKAAPAPAPAPAAAPTEKK